MKVLTLYATLLVGLVIVLALTGCALGLFQMSDRWCLDHQEASAARCHGR